MRFAERIRSCEAFRKELEGASAPALEPWDIGYYAEKQRQAKYDFNEEELRPYFPLDRVLRGLFATAQALYEIEIVERERQSLGPRSQSRMPFAIATAR